jgi:general stress protein 26
MDKQPQSSEGLAKLAELLDETSIAMLTTLEPDGVLRSRPLATRQFDAEGNLWFFTSLSSAKVHEIEAHPQVNLAYSNPKRADFVSICGTAEVVRDRAKMRALWTSWVEPWFPKGLDDPDLGLLRVAIEMAEYWDAPSSSVTRLLGLAKALQSGSTEALGEHRKVTPPRH